MLVSQIDYESKPLMTVTIAVVDNADGTGAKDFALYNVRVIDVNDIVVYSIVRAGGSNAPAADLSTAGNEAIIISGTQAVLLCVLVRQVSLCTSVCMCVCALLLCQVPTLASPAT